jgi:hypothetical protein
MSKERRYSIPGQMVVAALLEPGSIPGRMWGARIGSTDWEHGLGARKDGKQDGQGTYTWVNGNKYVGEWKDCKHHGLGARMWGARIGSTDWEHGCGEHGRMVNRTGVNPYAWVNGNKYVGAWKDGKHHGWEHGLGARIGSTDWEHGMGARIGSTDWEHGLGARILSKVP